MESQKRRRRLAKRKPRDLTKTSIEIRPNISSRAEFGHWAGDTVELIRWQSYLVTLVELKTRFLAMAHVENKRAETVRNAILSEFRHFSHAVKSITLDNGVEFADHKTIANCLSAPVYFAHPHSPWERGTNENTNRLLRQYFPKKTKATYSLAYLSDCRQKINTRPRKCLNFASPAQQFFRCLKLLQGGHLKVELTRLTLDCIENILSQYPENNQPIIILHGDHGRCLSLKDPMKYALGNLFALYIPEKWREKAKDLTFNNLYRFICNELFNTNYEYLPPKYFDGENDITKEILGEHTFGN